MVQTVYIRIFTCQTPKKKKKDGNSVQTMKSTTKMYIFILKLPPMSLMLKAMPPSISTHSKVS